MTGSGVNCTWPGVLLKHGVSELREVSSCNIVVKEIILVFTWGGGIAVSGTLHAVLYEKDLSYRF